MLLDFAADVRVNAEDRVLSKPELLDWVRGRDGVLTLLTDSVDAEVLEAAAPTCRVIANYAVGFSNVDVAEATRRGILVTNTPGVLTDAVADVTWALLFSVARRVVEGDALMRSGRFEGWSPTMLLGADITGRTLGIIGAGRIGTAVARRSRGFGMCVLYADRRRNAAIESELAAQKVDRQTLLEESDFVSVHVSLSRGTTHLIGRSELAMMKRTAYLINTSRGPVVDEAALVHALRAGTIAGAGLDVYEDEPAMAPGLAECPNAVLLPHIASATEWTRSKMAEMAAESLIAALRGETPPNLVNPEVLER
jgi:glyoxylate reductase